MSEMTTRAPALIQPEAKLSMRYFATGIDGAGSPLSELPAA